MELGAADSTAKRGPNRHLAVESASRARTVPPQLGADLMEGLRREAKKLNLRDRHHARDGETQRGADDACLGERCVDDTMCAMFLEQAGCGAEDAAQFSNVKSQNHHPRIRRHLLIEGVVYGFENIALRHVSLVSPRSSSRCRRNRSGSSE